MFSEKMAQVILALSYTAAVTHADTFNYRETSGDSYGPSDWNKVGCDDLEDCVRARKQDCKGKFHPSSQRFSSVHALLFRRDGQTNTWGRLDGNWIRICVLGAQLLATTVLSTIECLQ